MTRSPWTERASGGMGPAWLLTLADLVALLLAFFVMMYATQRVEKGDWDSLVKSLSQSLRTENVRPLPQPSAPENLRLLDRPRAIELPYLQALLEGLRRSEAELADVLFHRLDDRLIIALPSGLLFAPGDARPVAGARERVGHLALILRNVSNRIDVLGHTDPTPLSGAGRFASNRELSLARARSVAAMLREAGYERQLATFGLGSSRSDELAAIEPRARRYELARRVDIVVRDSREGR
jgi:chemotaxis protein MotB